MPILPVPEYKPDVHDYEQDSTQTLLNVLPLADGYGPSPDLSVYSAALPARCRGLFYARNADGSTTVLAATSTRLWKLNATDFTWIPISKVIALTSISNASPAVFTLVAHGLAIGDAIVLSTSSGLPTGLVVGTVYYVIAAGFTANAFEVSTSAGGSAVNTSSAGAGTHSFTGYYTAVPAADQWQFIQYNSKIVAVQTNTVPQVLDLTSPTAFTDLAGSPPQARYIAVVNLFVVLSGLTSSAPYRVQWSGLDAITTWDGTNSSDFEDLPDGGIVRGVAGGEYGLITQDSAIRRMIYAPGSAVVFQIERVAEEKGILAPLSLIRSGNIVFYIGSDGIKMVMPGGAPQAIGKDKVDRTLLADIDTSNLSLCIGVSSPRSSRVFFFYKSINGSANLFDKAICYDWALNKFSPLSGTGEYVASIARPGATLESLDTISSSIDALTFSLDDVATSILSSMAGVNSLHQVGFFTGAYVEATLVTSEHSGDGRRLRVQGFRPITDAPTVYGSVSARDTLSATATYTTETTMLASGMCPQNVSTRFTRGKMRIPAGTVWTYAAGIEAEVAIEGKR